MKRLTIVLAAALTLASASASAQDVGFHFGVLGGTTSDWIGKTDMNRNNSLCGWHAGVALEMKLPAYFAIQPHVLYDCGRSNVFVNALNDPLSSTLNELRLHTVSVPIAVQWGPDLGVVRPYVQVVPIFNFNVACDYKNQAISEGWFNGNDYINKFQFGMGIGLGFEIWKIQISTRYNWMLADWRQNPDAGPFQGNKSELTGVTFSVGMFF